MNTSSSFPPNQCLGSGFDGSARFSDPDPQKCADPRIRIHDAKYQPETEKKLYALKLHLNFRKKEIIKIY